LAPQAAITTPTLLKNYATNRQNKNKQKTAPRRKAPFYADYMQ